MRGVCPFRGRPALRTIPARAGEPILLPRRNSATTDHPRVCGGNPAADGDSPHRAGTIPARAGESSAAVLVSVIGRDHPRACGGTHFCAASNAASAGPSPRVRGNQHAGGGCDIDAGTIPARAGEPSALRGGATAGEDHPRACGGISQSGHRAIRRAGPSPRVRGEPVYAQAGQIRAWTIPARAGGTVAPTTCRAAFWDYPRACGGNWVRSVTIVGYPGPSPRVRGELPEVLVQEQPPGPSPRVRGNTG